MPRFCAADDIQVNTSADGECDKIGAQRARHDGPPSVGRAGLAEVGINYLGPNLMRVTDQLLGLYRTAGFELVEADHASKTVLGYVIGIASTEAATITKLNRGGMDLAAWRAAVWPAAVKAAEPYPNLRALYAAHDATDLTVDADDSFGYGLNRSSTAWSPAAATPRRPRSSPSRPPPRRWPAEAGPGHRVIFTSDPIRADS
jgi:hypothetical protein